MSFVMYFWPYDIAYIEWQFLKARVTSIVDLIFCQKDFSKKIKKTGKAKVRIIKLILKYVFVFF